MRLIKEIIWVPNQSTAVEPASFDFYAGMLLCNCTPQCDQYAKPCLCLQHALQCATCVFFEKAESSCKQAAACAIVTLSTQVTLAAECEHLGELPVAGQILLLFLY